MTPRFFPYFTAHLEGAKDSKMFPPVPEIIERMSTYMNLFSTAMKALHGNDLEQADDEKFPERQQLSLNKISDLRYGENPHQAGALYELGANGAGLSAGVAAAEQLGWQRDVLQQLC
jgi:AICAR transformylase/IMP cyclohydrolase PurH